jgi:hypothetical protein
MDYNELERIYDGLKKEEISFSEARKDLLLSLYMTRMGFAHSLYQRHLNRNTMKSHVENLMEEFIGPEADPEKKQTVTFTALTRLYDTVLGAENESLKSILSTIVQGQGEGNSDPLTAPPKDITEAVVTETGDDARTSGNIQKQRKLLEFLDSIQESEFTPEELEEFKEVIRQRRKEKEANEEPKSLEEKLDLPEN